MSKIERVDRSFASNPFDIPLPEWLSARVFYWVLFGISAVLLSYVFDKIQKRTHIPYYVVYVVGMMIIILIVLAWITLAERK